MSVKLLDTYNEMIIEKMAQFTTDCHNGQNLDVLKYGTVEGICEELGEVIRADRELKNLYSTDKDCTQDNLLEELGDLIFNISLFAANRGINLDTILEDNLTKIKRRG